MTDEAACVPTQTIAQAQATVYALRSRLVCVPQSSSDATIDTAAGCVALTPVPEEPRPRLTERKSRHGTMTVD
jgi:hypothetical protein